MTPASSSSDRRLCGTFSGCHWWLEITWYRYGCALWQLQRFYLLQPDGKTSVRESCFAWRVVGGRWSRPHEVSETVAREIAANGEKVMLEELRELSVEAAEQQKL